MTKEELRVYAGILAAYMICFPFLFEINLLLPLIALVFVVLACVIYYFAPFPRIIGDKK